jgi:copper(I)-binding protein
MSDTPIFSTAPARRIEACMKRRSILLAVPALLMAKGFASAQQPGAISVEAPWTRAAGQGMQGAGYLTLRNTGAEDRLVSASTPAAARVELHTHLRDGEVMRMRPVQAIPVPAQGSVTLQPSGLHLMMIGLTRPLIVGESIPLTLRFERAGEIEVQLAVQAAGARGPRTHGH